MSVTVGTRNESLGRAIREAIAEAQARDTLIAVGIVTRGDGARFWSCAPWGSKVAADMDYRLRVTGDGVADDCIGVPGGVYPPRDPATMDWEFTPPVEPRGGGRMRGAGAPESAGPSAEQAREMGIFLMRIAERCTRISKGSLKEVAAFLMWCADGLEKPAEPDGPR